MATRKKTTTRRDAKPAATSAAITQQKQATNREGLTRIMASLPATVSVVIGYALGPLARPESRILGDFGRFG